MKTIFVTGSAGLVGSCVCSYFDSVGWNVVGLDNNGRKEYFGAGGDTSGNLQELVQDLTHYLHYNADIRNRGALFSILKQNRPDAVVHCAAQPAHEWSKAHPLDDFDINVGGTVSLLEAARQHCPESPFIFMSSSKVYGSSVNDRPLEELPWRFEGAEIGEGLPLDGSWHSPYGAHKAAADIIVQEFGYEFGMPTVCLRPNCMTGTAHAGVEMHGFLSYMVRCARTETPYRIFGYEGKQVRDNIDSFDVCAAIECILEDTSPDVAQVYNLGGGRGTDVSIIEALDILADYGFPIETKMEEARGADHKFYVTDNTKFRSRYPGWSITRDLDFMLDDMLFSAIHEDHNRKRRLV